MTPPLRVLPTTCPPTSSSVTPPLLVEKRDSPCMPRSEMPPFLAVSASAVWRGAQMRKLTDQPPRRLPSLRSGPSAVTRVPAAVTWTRPSNALASASSSPWAWTTARTSTSAWSHASTRMPPLGEASTVSGPTGAGRRESRTSQAWPRSESRDSVHGSSVGLTVAEGAGIALARGLVAPHLEPLPPPLGLVAAPFVLLAPALGPFVVAVVARVPAHRGVYLVHHVAAR